MTLTFRFWIRSFVRSFLFSSSFFSLSEVSCTLVRDKEKRKERKEKWERDKKGWEEGKHGAKEEGGKDEREREGSGSLCI